MSLPNVRIHYQSQIIDSSMVAGISLVELPPVVCARIKWLHEQVKNWFNSLCLTEAILNDGPWKLPPNQPHCPGTLGTHGLTSVLLFVVIQVGTYLKTCQSVPMMEAIHWAWLDLACGSCLLYTMYLLSSLAQ